MRFVRRSTDDADVDNAVLQYWIAWALMPTPVAWVAGTFTHGRCRNDGTIKLGIKTNWPVRCIGSIGQKLTATKTSRNCGTRGWRIRGQRTTGICGSNWARRRQETLPGHHHLFGRPEFAVRIDRETAKSMALELRNRGPMRRTSNRDRQTN